MLDKVTKFINSQVPGDILRISERRSDWQKLQDGPKPADPIMRCPGCLGQFKKSELKTHACSRLHRVI